MMKKYINLLPPEEQQEIRLARINYQIQNFGSWLVLSIFVLLVFLVIARMFLISELEVVFQQVREAAHTLSDSEKTKIRAEVQGLNQDLKNANILQAANQSWSPILRELASILPADVTLDSLKITREEKKIEINGRAAKRDSVLQFRRNLIGSENFQNVNFPLMNIEKATDAPWKYRFYIKPKT